MIPAKRIVATAFAIAGAVGMIGGSASPRAPRGLAFVSTLSTQKASITGASANVGTL